MSSPLSTTDKATLAEDPVLDKVATMSNSQAILLIKKAARIGGPQATLIKAKRPSLILKANADATLTLQIASGYSTSYGSGFIATETW